MRYILPLVAASQSACAVETVLVPGETGPAGEAGPPGTFDEGAVQSRVHGNCPPGEAIRAIDPGGAVACEPDDDSKYIAGDGLQLQGDIFSVDSSVSRWDHAHPEPGVTLGGLPTSLQGLADAVGALQEQITLLQATDCPRLVLVDGTTRVYERDLAATGWIECTYELAPGFTDTMVRVGDFWIDQYEAFVASTTPAECGGTFGKLTGHDTTARPCSVRNQVPVSGLSQLQALSSCANVGKHLCTSMEWQTAASGTVDPGAWPVDSFDTGCDGPASVTSCTTCAGALGLTGQAAQCFSRFGAYDMIGNQAELVGDWVTARGLSTVETDQEGTWPPAFGGDRTGTFLSNACVTTDCAEATGGMLAALFRGGGRNDGVLAGVFFIVASRAPGVPLSVGFRCCAGRQ